MAETEKADGISLAPEYRALQDAFDQLQKKISPGGIVGSLFSRNLLLLNEVDMIRSKPIILEKNEELLLAMCKRSPAQVLQFCQFLLEEQCHCGNILKEALQRRGVDTSSLTVASLEPSAVSHVAAKYYPQIEDLDLLEKQLLQRMDALREMMSGDAKAQPQGEGEVPEKDLPVDSEATSNVWELSEPPSNKSKLKELEPEEEDNRAVLFEEVQSAFARYAIEVGTWGDVPLAVQKLAHKQGKEPPTPDALMQTPTYSDFLLVWNNIGYSSWSDLAAHLGCLPDYIMKLQSGEQFCRGDWEALCSYRDSCRIQLMADWLNTKEGTGNEPRTWKTVLKAFRRCCGRYEEGRAEVSAIETKLIEGTELC